MDEKDTKSLPRRFKKAVFFSLSSFLLVGTALAGPNGASIEAGNATILGQGSNNVLVNQSTNRVVINWQSFDTTIHEGIEFRQPNAQSVAVNRVTNGQQTSFLGSLRANGQVILINPNGVVLGESANVDVNKLVISTADVATTNAMNDAKLLFNRPGKKDAKIINKGKITIGQAGLVGFVAPHVENSGEIVAKLGKVKLASGSTFTLDLAGDDLVNIAVSDDVVKQIALNSGKISADGGHIAITAADARNVVDRMVVNTGIIEAQSVSQKNGKIILGGATANVLQTGIINATGIERGGDVVITAKQAAIDGVVNARSSNGVGGSIAINTTEFLTIADNAVFDVTGKKGGNITLQSPILFSAGKFFAQGHGGIGGTIKALGDDLYLMRGSYMDTSGTTGGGHIYIGGDYQGTGDMHRAKNTHVDAYTLFVNDALESGNGGQTIVWADKKTEFYGNVLSRGKGSGKGGFVEISGKDQLAFDGFVDLTSESGVKGTLLLDPDDITIYGNVNPNFISTDGSINLSTNLKLWLDSADSSTIALTYSNTGFVATTITGSSGTNTLTTSTNISTQLTAGSRIRIGSNGAVTVASTMGADTYTVASVSGTTITTVEALTTTYTGASVYRGLVSAWNDKSGNSNNATQATQSDMPMFVDRKINNRSVVRFDGVNDIMSALDSPTLDNTSGLTIITVNTPLTMSGSPNAILSKRIGIDDQYSYSMFYYTGNKMSIDIVNSNNRFTSTQTYAANNTYMMSVVYDGTQAQASRVRFYNQNNLSSTFAENNASIPDNNSPLWLGGLNNGYSSFLNADFSDVIIYNTALSDTNRTLVDQYLAGKWNQALNTPGTGATENAKATSATGYNVFTTGYLEKLSQTADVNLLAVNTIKFDLKGDTLNLANDRSVSFTTTNGNISSVSSGTIQTNRTGSGGNISFTAGGTGLVDIGNITLNAQNGGVVNVNAGGAITLGNITSGGVTAQTTGAGSLLTAGAINVGTGSISLTADDMNLTGTLTGTGTLTLQQNAVNRILNVNYGTDNGSSLHLSTAEIGRFANNWNAINIGRTNGNNDIFVGASSWVDPVTFRNAYRKTVTGAISATDNASVSFTGGWVDLYNSITTLGQKVDMSGAGYTWVGSMAGGGITTNGGNILFNQILSQNNGNMNISSGGGNISIADTIYGGNGAGRTFIFDSGAGSIAFGGTVNTLANITATGNTISLNGAWGATSRLGNVSLTATNGALSLPSILATNLFAQSASGQNITTTGALNTNGAGNSLVLASGNHFINSGGSLTASAGRYLVYSANPGNNTLGGIVVTTKRYNKTYAGYAPASVTETGNVFLYYVAPVITVTANNATRVYGDANPTFTASYGGYIDGDTFGSALSGSPSLTTLANLTTNVGNQTISAAAGSLASALGYQFTYADGMLGITPAALTITADNKTKVYGTVNPGLTASYSGFKNGEDEAVLSGLILSTSAVIGSNVANYAILASGATASNYTITHTNGTLSVTPAALTITAVDKTKIYGAANPALSLSFNGLVNGDTDTVFSGYSLTTDALTGSNVGNYNINLTGGSASNYTITRVNGNLSVTPASLIITAADKTKIYGDANPTLTLGFNGLVNGDTDSVFTGYSLTTDALLGSNVGTYNINLTGGSASNYTITRVGGNLNVTPAALTITADNKSKVYGAANPGLTATISGLKNGDNQSVLNGLVLNTAANSSSGVNSYAITASGTSASNYTITHNNGTLTVTPASLTVMADSKTKTYGSNNPSLSLSFSGLVNGDSNTVFTGYSLTTDALTGSNVGTYDINLTGGSAANYSITRVDGNLTVTPAALTIQADSKSKTYGAANPSLSLTFTGLVNGDDESIFSGYALGTTATTGTNVGNYAITLTGGSAGSNYTVTRVNGNLNISAASLTVTAVDKTKTYGDVNPALSLHFDGLINGDTDSIFTGYTLNTSATTGSNVNNYAINLSGGSAANYTITRVNGILSVTPAPLTIQAVSKTKTYGNVNPALTMAFTGLKNGDTQSVFTGYTLSTLATTGSNVGTYGINLTGGSAGGNYSVTRVGGNLTVTPAALVVSAADKMKAFGDVNPALTLNFSGLVNGDDGSIFTGYTLGTAALMNSPAGTYTITLTGGNAGTNYTVSRVDGTLTITSATPVTPPVTTPPVQPKSSFEYKQLWQPELTKQNEGQLVAEAIANKNLGGAYVQSSCLYQLKNFDGDGSISIGGCSAAR